MTAPLEPAVLLEDLSEDERGRRFAALQARMPAVWEAMRSEREGESVVIVPSRVIAASPRAPDRIPVVRGAAAVRCCFCSASRGCGSST